eukprot:3502453-Rhodomonas_salina.1
MAGRGSRCHLPRRTNNAPTFGMAVFKVETVALTVNANCRAVISVRIDRDLSPKQFPSRSLSVRVTVTVRCFGKARAVAANVGGGEGRRA